jgi:hypothetical protein
MSNTVAAPARSPGIVHPASERRMARARFTARIYRPARDRDEWLRRVFVASHGHAP